MIEKPMKSLAVGEVKYIITDAEAREDIETLQTNVTNINTDVTEIAGDVTDLKSDVTGMTTATVIDEGKALKAKTVSGGKVTEWEFGESGSGLTATQANLLLTILGEGVYGSDQESNIELLRKALMDIAPVSISAVLDSTPLVGLYYADLEFTVTATFDDESTLVVDGYRIVTPGAVVSGSNTVTVAYRGVTTNVTFTASDVVTHTITYNLANVTSSNKAYLIVDGERYETDISASSTDYEIASCIVTMGGVDITSTVYVESAHTIIIPAVTGNIEIVAVGSAYQYLDPFIDSNGENFSTLFIYSDDGTTQVQRINYTGRRFVSEYPASADCTIQYSIKNITDSDVSIGIPWFGGVPSLVSTQFNNYSYNAIWYAEGVQTVSQTLSPGQTVEGQFSVKAGYQAAYVITNNLMDSLEFTLKGNFVPNTFADYTEYVLNNTLPRYGAYRSVTYYNSDEQSLGSVNNHKSLISDSLNIGAYHAIVKMPAKNYFMAGMMANNTDVDAYGSVGANYKLAPNIWYDIGTLTVTDSYPNFVSNESNGVELKLKKVVTSGD